MGFTGQQMLRPEFTFSDSCYMEKRQLFLRSYQFSRKKTVVERIKHSLIRVKRLVWLKLRSVRKLRRLVWSRLHHAIARRRFRRLVSRSNAPYWSLSSCC